MTERAESALMFLKGIREVYGKRQRQDSTENKKNCTWKGDKSVEKR